MKKLLLIFTLFLSIILISSCGKSVEGKASELFDAGMFEQAKIYLTEEIVKDPKNASLHFLLGKCLLAANNLNQAQEEFNRAIRLDVDQADLIGAAYFEVGEKLLLEEKYEYARTLFGLVFKYDPNFEKTKIGNTYSEAAINKINVGDAESFKYLFLTAIYYNPNSIDRMHQAAKQKTENITSPNEISLLTTLTQLFLTNVPEQSDYWIDLTYNFVNEHKNSISPERIISTLNLLASQNTQTKNKITKFYQERTRYELDQKSYHAVSLYINSLNEMDYSALVLSLKNVWDEIKVNLDKIKNLGKNNFVTLFRLCNEFADDVEFSKSIEYTFADALYLYTSGYRDRSIIKFNEVIKKTSSESSINKLAASIIEPPKVGSRKIYSEPIRISGRRGNIDITLIELVIKVNEINLIFAAKAVDDKVKLLFIPKEREIRGFGAVITGKELLNILDDNGKVFNAKNGFVGGNQDDFNNTVKEIQIRTFEEVILTVSFPLPSPGSTKVTFISPRLNGWQSEWVWNDIILKNGPFD